MAHIYFYYSPYIHSPSPPNYAPVTSRRGSFLRWGAWPKIEPKILLALSEESPKGYPYVLGSPKP